ncbi:MAG: hypothetical protein KGL39_49510 [Patescibacteria group bacterium]|nr:hypothetical protein [Patescibacteria group bacterium]
MSWDVAKSCFLAGYENYQTHGPNCQSPWQSPGDKRCGLWVAGKDAARKRLTREEGWRRFRDRERLVA